MQIVFTPHHTPIMYARMWLVMRQLFPNHGFKHLGFEDGHAHFRDPDTNRSVAVHHDEFYEGLPWWEVTMEKGVASCSSDLFKIPFGDGAKFFMCAPNGREARIIVWAQTANIGGLSLREVVPPQAGAHTYLAEDDDDRVAVRTVTVAEGAAEMLRALDPGDIQVVTEGGFSALHKRFDANTILPFQDTHWGVFSQRHLNYWNRCTRALERYCGYRIGAEVS